MLAVKEKKHALPYVSLDQWQASPDMGHSMTEEWKLEWRPVTDTVWAHGPLMIYTQTTQWNTQRLQKQRCWVAMGG